MKAIKTYYLPPTTHKGPRIVATDGDGNKIIKPWKHSLTALENHKFIARELCLKMGWDLELNTGCHANAYYHIFAE